MPKSPQRLGGLYVVATPIGNMEDMTLRGIEVLRSVDLVAVEDTRHSVKLLRRHGIDTPVVSYHDQNESERSRLHKPCGVGTLSKDTTLDGTVSFRKSTLR